tara:strand:+ start:111 stop:350 length:240 start_codon:yes stop_codon:yes gene_type:complete
MSTNYEFHWSRTHYYRNTIYAESLEEATNKQRILFEECDWGDFEDDNEITYYQLEWVDERRATDAEQEYFNENFDKELE